MTSKNKTKGSQVAIVGVEWVSVMYVLNLNRMIKNIVY